VWYIEVLITDDEDGSVLTFGPFRFTDEKVRDAAAEAMFKGTNVVQVDVYDDGGLDYDLVKPKED
jgi:hypothetical protein